MPGANGDRKGVRFAVQDGMEDENRHRHVPRVADDGGGGGGETSSLRNSSRTAGEGRHQSKKRPRPEQRNVDEIDDIDDWRPEDDDDDIDNDEIGGAVGLLSEKALLEAKRARRLRRVNQLPRGDGLDGGGDADEDVEENGEAHGGSHREAGRWGRTRGTSLLDADDNDGIPITPFNMNEEENDGDGYFDGDTYVFRHGRGGGGGGGGGDDDEPDAWADASDDEFNEASASVPTTGGRFLASTRAAAEENVRRGANFDDWTERELYAKILPLVSDTETVTGAIVRYGGLIRHQSKSPSGDSSTSTSPASARAQDALNELTEASSALLLKGHVDIYQKTRADLLRLLPERGNGAREESAAPQRGDLSHEKRKVVQWEYMGNEDKQIHGPYTSEQMRQWTSTGYFVGASAVQIRPIYAEERAERDITLQDDLMNDLMDDEDEGEGDVNGHADNVGVDEKPASTGPIRGEWQQSDQVNFGQFD